MKAIICGGRDEEDGLWVWQNLDRIDAERRIDHVIEGGQRKWRYVPDLKQQAIVGGVDFHAFRWAKRRRRECETVKADWTTFGKAAGPLRNRRMAEMGADVLIAFDGGNGTADMIRRAKARGIEVITVTRSET